MKEVDGLINAKRPKPPNPKPSPKDFVWPSQADHDDVVARKIAATLQELLPKKDMKHTHLARALWGTDKDGKIRNIGKARGWVTADHPIPNEEHAGYLAEVLDISMARLLEPEGKFNPHPDMIRERSPNGINKWKQKKKGGAIKVKLKAKPATDMRGKWKRPKAAAAGVKRKYVRRAVTNGSGATEGAAHDPNVWILEQGVPVPEYQMNSHDEIPNHVQLTINAVVPQPRAMAILHMLECLVPADEE